jgi:decaprenylphospho-beta-D-erythro-pentofuranosid-2-ulose 2-reductase
MDRHAAVVRNTQGLRVSSTTAVFGATSAIAEAWCERRAAQGDRLLLFGRNLERMDAFAAHLRVRHQTKVQTIQVDFDDAADRIRAIEQLVQWTPDGLNTVLVAYGWLPVSDDALDPQQTARALRINFTTVVDLLCRLAARLEEQKWGDLVVLSSVAGDRGRAINLAYGAAKAGLSAYMSGLRAQLNNSGVSVYTIKPGPVDTPMTAHLPKGALFTSPERVAQDIDKAILRRRYVCYSPWWWQWIMLVIKLIPERLFMKVRF